MAAESSSSATAAVASSVRPWETDIAFCSAYRLYPIVLNVDRNSLPHAVPFTPPTFQTFEVEEKEIGGREKKWGRRHNEYKTR